MSPGNDEINCFASCKSAELLKEMPDEMLNIGYPTSDFE